jgi:hypothetical protein
LATGGFLGMTAAAAIRWLNGEDFSLFPPKQDPITPQIETLVEELRQQQQQQQDQIIQRITNVWEKQSEKQRTNECVNLLRTKPLSENVAPIMLMQIQSELTALRQTLQENKPWEKRLSDTLDNLHNCMEHLRGTNVDDSNHHRNSHTAPLVARQDDDNTIEHAPTLETSIQTLLEHNPTNDLRAGSQLLFLYISNLLHHPTAPRYRKIYTSNDSFLKVDRLRGGKEFLLALGFVEKGTYLEWQPHEDKNMASLQCAMAALHVLKTVPPVIEPEFVERVILAARGTSCPPTPTVLPSLDALKTPEIGRIASPPNTRKQHLEKPAFPLLHGNDNDNESPVLSMSSESNRERTTEESPSPIRDSSGETEATDALWK